MDGYDRNTTDVALSRKSVESAVSTYWQGGGVASRLIDILIEERATASEAREVAERLAERVEGGRTFTGDAVIREELEYARARAALSSTARAKTLALAREGDALAREWAAIERTLQQHGVQVNIDLLRSIYAGVGSETLRTGWRSLLVGDWACLMRTQVPACLQ